MSPIEPLSVYGAKGVIVKRGHCGGSFRRINCNVTVHSLDPEVARVANGCLASHHLVSSDGNDQECDQELPTAA